MKLYFHAKRSAVLLVLVCLYSCSSEPEAGPQAMGQYPSPMADSVRRHERMENKEAPGLSIELEGVLVRPVEIYWADQDYEIDQMDMLIHFHGAGYIAKQAVYEAEHPIILAVVNLGAGSSVYERGFQEESVFPSLIESIIDSVSRSKGGEIEASRIYLSGFSAGYGAVRAILKGHQAEVDGVILLDGLHTGYVPPRKVLAEGGEVDEAKLRDLVYFARLAVEGEKRMLITHSEIFPGTYASTTETTDYIIKALNLERGAVLRWGPVGMQLLSETRVKGLTILGFAGNSAPDHIDHFHGLPAFLKIFLENY